MKTQETMGTKKAMGYDVVVVGAGMIGSATARHLLDIDPSLDVCLIGPSEPRTKDSYADQPILGSYYDEGRLARQLYTHPGWATIARRAAKNYRQLEKESGIHFFTEVGCLTIMQPGTDYHRDHEKIAQQLNIKVQKLSRDEARGLFPYIDYKGSDVAWFEAEEAGYVNPRKLVLAEQTLAQKRGCTTIDDVVTRLRECERSRRHGATGMEVSTKHSGKLLARKVMLATGAFTEFSHILPRGLLPDMKICTETVVLAEVSEVDQEYMRNMPCLMYNGGGHEVEGRNYLYTYILPPIRYPNGKVYLKIGHMDFDGAFKYLDNLADIHAHYRSPGLPGCIDMLTKIMNKLFPAFRPVSMTTDTCVTTETPSSRAFLDLLSRDLGVVIGGNGTAGKSCDELGKMAAELIYHGRWVSDLPREWFEFKARTPKVAAKL